MMFSCSEYETKLVEDFCEPSGARPVPAKDIVRKFVTQCSALDTNLVCALIEDKLDLGEPDTDDWKMCLRAIYGIEALTASCAPSPAVAASHSA